MWANPEVVILGGGIMGQEADSGTKNSKALKESLVSSHSRSRRD